MKAHVVLCLPLLKRTWSDSTVTLPLQNQRGRSRTVYGAVGGDRLRVRWIYAVTNRTNQTDTVNFLREIIFHSGVPARRLAIVLDNHSARTVARFAASCNLRLIFTPPYSCSLNICEHVWSAFKRAWARRLATVTRQLTAREMELLVMQTNDRIGANLTPRILSCTD